MLEGVPHLVQASDMMAMRQLSSTMLMVKTKRHLQKSSGQGADQGRWEDVDVLFAECCTEGHLCME